MLIGVRAHDFGKLPVDELAPRITAKGFTSIQLALTKAIYGMDSDAGKLSPGLANYIKSVFLRHNIQIAVLGCYINPIHPDPEVRAKSLSRFREHIRYARDFGCSVIGTETGSVNADWSFHPDNRGPEALQMLIESIAELVSEAEKFGVMVGIEGVTSHTVCNPSRMKHALTTINSPNLQVIFDPVNLLDETNYTNQEEIIREAFALFGERIVILHAKDFVIDNGRKKTVPPGQGLLNYPLILKWLKENKPYINILLEDNRPETMDEGKNFLAEVYERV